jgi:hypothetical protein
LFTEDEALGQGLWLEDDVEFPFTLSACKNLKEFCISTLIPWTLAADKSIECALPAIVRLLKTAPSDIQTVILSFECEIPDTKFLGQLDWSLLDFLQGVCPRIELRVRGSDDPGHWFPPEVILDALAGSKALMGLVRRNLVILKPFTPM